MIGVIEMNDYLTIAEFAKLAGVSRQTVYNRIDKDLSSFVKVFDNRKRIHKTALSLFLSDIHDNFNGSDTKSNSNMSSDFTRLIDNLTGELDNKNMQIKMLMKQNETLTELLKSTQEQLSASMALHAGTLQAQLQTSEDHEEQSGIKNDNPPDQEHIEQQDKPKSEQQLEAEPTRLWGKLFGIFRTK